MNYLLKYYFENEIGKMLQFFSGFSLEWINIDYYGVSLESMRDTYTIEIKFKYSSLLYTNIAHVWERLEIFNGKEELEDIIHNISNKLASIEKEFRRKEAELNAKEN